MNSSSCDALIMLNFNQKKVSHIFGASCDEFPARAFITGIPFPSRYDFRVIFGEEHAAVARLDLSFQSNATVSCTVVLWVLVLYRNVSKYSMLYYCTYPCPLMEIQETKIKIINGTRSDPSFRLLLAPVRWWSSMLVFLWFLDNPCHPGHGTSIPSLDCIA